MIAKFTDQSADLFYSWARRHYPSLTWTILSGPGVAWSDDTGISGVLYGLPTHLPNNQWEPILRAFLEVYR